MAPAWKGFKRGRVDVDARSEAYCSACWTVCKVRAAQGLHTAYDRMLITNEKGAGAEDQPWSMASLNMCVAEQTQK